MAPLIGVPAQIRGDLVILPGVGVIEIASGCSGVNFFTVGLAVAALLGELEQASLRRRALLVTAMGALAVFANWLRVLIIVDAGLHDEHAARTRVARPLYVRLGAVYDSHGDVRMAGRAPQGIVIPGVGELT